MGSVALSPTKEVTCRSGCHGMESDKRSQSQLALQVWHRVDGPDWLPQQNPTIREKESEERRETQPQSPEKLSLPARLAVPWSLDVW